MHESQGNYKYDMILGRKILSELNIDLCFYENITRGMKALTKDVKPQ